MVSDPPLLLPEQKPSSKVEQFRNLLKQPTIFQLPGVYDCISAKICEQVGFQAIYTSGLSISATKLGVADIGLMSASENLEVVKHIVSSVNIPVVADCDTGYGDCNNVYRLTRDAIQVGVAAICLEDQQWPKRCGHFTGQQVISCEEHVSKIRAAVEASKDYAFENGNEQVGDRDHSICIVGRTDARNPLGLNEAIRRAREYYDAGAEMVFVEAPKSMDELKTISHALDGIPVLVNFIEGGHTPIENVQQLDELGFRAVMYSTSGLLASMKSLFNIYETIRDCGTTKPMRESNQMCSFGKYQEMVGLTRFMERKQRLEASIEPNTEDPYHKRTGKRVQFSTSTFEISDDK